MPRGGFLAESKLPSKCRRVGTADLVRYRSCVRPVWCGTRPLAQMGSVTHSQTDRRPYYQSLSEAHDTLIRLDIKGATIEVEIEAADGASD